MYWFKKLKGKIRRYLRRSVIAVGKRVPWFLRWARSVVYTRRERAYQRMCEQMAVDHSMALFEAYSGRRFACSPRALYECLMDPAASPAAPVRAVWAMRKGMAYAFAQRGFDVRGLDPRWEPKTLFDLDAAFGADALDSLRRAIIVPFGSREHDAMYAQAGLWVSNSRLPRHLEPRAGQAYVQSWHGTPLKRIGCDLNHGGSENALYKTDEMHENYQVEGETFTYLLSPSAFATEKFASAFDLVSSGQTGKIIEEGYPRNDFLTTHTAADEARIRARLGIAEGKRVVLYAPTWRDNQHSTGVGYTYSAEADFDALREAFGEDAVILFRAHYFIGNTFDFSAYDGFVIDVSRIDDIDDLYVVADVLITDYSSVFFDYANLRRPIIFYMYDLEFYESELRGFYLGLDELPGPVVRTTDELRDALRVALDPAAPEDPRYQGFCDRFTYLDDGHAAQRVIARLVEAGALPSAEGGDLTSSESAEAL